MSHEIASSPSRVKQTFLETAENFEVLAEMAGEVDRVADALIDRLSRGGKILICGNGGSAADAQHFAGELMGRYLLDRDPLPALALGTNTSSMTAIANDYSYEEVFEREIRAIGRENDALVAISTSGESRNVIRALEAARSLNMLTVSLTGAGGGQIAALCDLCLRVPSDITPRIQEMHLAVYHALCEKIEREMS